MQAIEGFGRFLKTTQARVRLLPSERDGLPTSLRRASHRGLQHCGHVEWIDEMSNTLLRRLYQLSNTVVCDQFDLPPGYLGSIGGRRVCSDARYHMFRA